MSLFVTQSDLDRAENNADCIQSLHVLGYPDVKRYFYNRPVEYRCDTSPEIMKLIPKHRGYILSSNSTKACLLNAVRRYKKVSKLVYDIIKTKFELGNEDVIITVGFHFDNVVLMFNDRITYVMTRKTYNASYMQLKPFLNISNIGDTKWKYFKVDTCDTMRMFFFKRNSASMFITEATLVSHNNDIETMNGTGSYTYMLDNSLTSFDICNNIQKGFNDSLTACADGTGIEPCGDARIFASCNNSTWTHIRDFKNIKGTV